MTTIFNQEMRQGKNTLIIWTTIIAFMLSICILIYPEMSNQINELSDVFSNLGGFSAAFGMDKLNFGEFTSFFGVECGNILGLGGAFFAALIGISSLAKEEKEHTAEFILSHPISRPNIVLQKFISVIIQIIILNIVSIGITAISTLTIGESPEIKILALMFVAYLIMQIETASICFCISAFLNNSGFGIGLGIAALFYFLNITSNLTDKAKFLKYITPFGYTDSSDIIVSGTLETKYLITALIITMISIITAFLKYSKKDII